MHSAIHDWRVDLDRENQEAVAPYWEHLYRKWWPDLARLTVAPRGSAAQKRGIDRSLTLISTGDEVRTVTVQEKIRFHAYRDILIETDAGCDGKGCHLETCAADFYVYLIKPTATAYLWPVEVLRHAWLTHGPEWMRTGRTCRANNGTYWSTCVAVPLSALPAPKVATLLPCEMRTGAR